MPEVLEQLLSEMEQESARALELAEAGETINAGEAIAKRGDAIARLNKVLEESGPVSYEDWNRLVVVHYQGNRIAASLAAARARIAGEFLESARENAYLECITGVVQEDSGPGQLDERG